MGSLYRAALTALALPARVFRGILPANVADPLSFEVRSAVGRTFAKRMPVDRSGETFLDLGAAETAGGSFVSIDFFGKKGVYGADLRYPLPIDDACISGIFSEHTIEHLSFDEAARLLAECLRVLKPGGRIRIIVPDVSIFARNYVAGNTQWFEDWEREMLGPRGKRLFTPMQAISFVTQEHGHRSAWDFESLQSLLAQVGFADVQRADFGVGAEPRLIRDRNLKSRIMTSVYVEASKPMGAQAASPGSAQ